MLRPNEAEKEGCLLLYYNVTYTDIVNDSLVQSNRCSNYASIKCSNYALISVNSCAVLLIDIIIVYNVT